MIAECFSMPGKNSPLRESLQVSKVLVTDFWRLRQAWVWEQGPRSWIEGAPCSSETSGVESCNSGHLAAGAFGGKPPSSREVCGNVLKPQAFLNLLTNYLGTGSLPVGVQIRWSRGPVKEAPSNQLFLILMVIFAGIHLLFQTASYSRLWMPKAIAWEECLGEHGRSFSFVAPAAALRSLPNTETWNRQDALHRSAHLSLYHRDFLL